MYNHCDKCVADKSLCSHCRDNPEVQKILASLPKLSFFMNYVPVCPRGYLDCVYDPAYIHFTIPIGIKIFMEIKLQKKLLKNVVKK